LRIIQQFFRSGRAAEWWRDPRPFFRKKLLAFACSSRLRRRMMNMPDLSALDQFLVDEL